MFLRLLAVVYLFAFWSLALQVDGLIGADGVLPAREYLSAAAAWADANAPGLQRYRVIPTLFWLDASDAVLRIAAWAGVGLAALLAAGIAPLVVLPVLWALYLSFAEVSGEFLGYQWDALLLETGLLAIAVAPLRWRHRLRDAPDPSPVARWLLWWLLFRLMFGSGVVKLVSGDASWRGLTAMAVHYETQPLPTPLAWYVHQFPGWAHQATTAAVLAIELIVPSFILFGRRFRIIAAAVFVVLQAVIALTGNYAFFNPLTVALCLPLLDDRALSMLRRGAASSARRAWQVHVVPALLATLIVPTSAALVLNQFGYPMPSLLAPVFRAVAPLRSVNPYGLFAVMTTSRPEIVVEGSRDGSTWHEYEFRHKPGSLTRPPAWIAPFQPRLDWQMWFAALGRYEQERWFQRFLQRLLEGSPPVTRLLARNPFGADPPHFVRATLYRYRFTNRETMGEQRTWWMRERVAEYAPPVSQ